MQNIQDAYLELAELLVSKVPAIKHVDLWYEQVYNQQQEDPYPSPAVFLELNSTDAKTTGNNAQELDIAIKVYTELV